MSTNPYAPPKSVVADIGPGPGDRPALWNPWAATLWSLVLSPAFGSYLHMRNWHALGEDEKARTQKAWFTGFAAFIAALSVSAVLLPKFVALQEGASWISLPLLLAWYYLAGKEQRAFIEARYGKDYPRRGWLKPLGAFLLAFFAVVVVAALAGFVLGTHRVA